MKGLATPLSVAQGGTGASSTTGARLVLGLGDIGTSGFLEVKLASYMTRCRFHNG